MLQPLYSIMKLASLLLHGSHEKQGFLVIPETFPRTGCPLSSIKSVAVEASGHSCTHCPRRISKQDQVGAGFKAISTDDSCDDEHGVDPKLEHVLVLSPVDKRRYTAAEYQTRN